MRAKIPCLVLFLLVFITFSSLSHGQWIPGGEEICTALESQWNPQAVSDGLGGAIIGWGDHRSADNWDIYLQRVDAAGEIQWASNGIALCTASDLQEFQAIASDGEHGAIAVWEDNRSGVRDIYAQRVTGSGLTQWVTNGIVVCSATDDQWAPGIVPDGQGGAIVVWEDERSGAPRDIYAQRIDASGVPQWAGNGVALCAAANGQRRVDIASDGAGGAIVAWIDKRRNNTNWDIYAQRVNGSGVAQWTMDGVELCNATLTQIQGPTITSDGAGGAIVAWNDYRLGHYAIYAQRVDAAGSVQWPSNGATICAAAGHRYSPEVLSDGSGGVFIAWQDNRAGGLDPIAHIYAHRVDASGVVQWTTDGVPVCTAENIQFGPQLVSDGDGGVFITWNDSRRDFYSRDVYAQRVDGAGNMLWPENGIPLSTLEARAEGAVIVSNDSGGAIVTWTDSRNWSTSFDDIYVQQIGSSPSTGLGTVVRSPGLAVAHNYPNPFATGTHLQFSPATESDVSIDVFDVAGRRVRGLEIVDAPAGWQRVLFDGLDDRGKELPCGVYFYRVTAAGASVTHKMVIAR